MIVLGLNHGEINSSAAIIKDGKLVAGSTEERFNRQKKTSVFPSNAVSYCLEEVGVTLADCDYVAQAWNPYAALTKFNPFVSSAKQARELYLYGIPDHLAGFANRESESDYSMLSFDQKKIPPIYYIKHHRTHAAGAYFLSPFDEAAILTADWKGEFESATMGIGNGSKFEITNNMQLPHSLGSFYATFTELLGYRPDSDEWKVMALSAFDLDCDDYYKKIRSTVNLTDDGFFEMDLSYYKGAIMDQPNLYTEKLKAMFGGRTGIKGEEAGEWHIRIAKAMQKVSEEIVVHMLSTLHKQTGCKNLCLGGGFFMNSVLNGKIQSLTPFENIYIPYAPTDAGNSIGAALYVAHQIHDAPRSKKAHSSHIGPAVKNEDADKALNRRKIKHTKESNPEQKIAQLLAEGEVVAVCLDRMEFGERALGNRSILGDPRSAKIKDKINSIIKYRENYRPFAPVIPEDIVSKYFEVEEGFTCPYMEKVIMVRPEWRDKIPATVHVDGSGRVQTINSKDNPIFTKIIMEFEKLTGIPIVLNTSFNINGEPIVLSADDAINTFSNSGLEHLMVGNCYLSK